MPEVRRRKGEPEVEDALSNNDVFELVSDEDYIGDEGGREWTQFSYSIFINLMLLNIENYFIRVAYLYRSTELWTTVA